MPLRRARPPGAPDLLVASSYKRPHRFTVRMTEDELEELSQLEARLRQFFGQGDGIDPEAARHTATIVLPEDLYLLVNSAAAAAGISVNSFLRRVLTQTRK